MQPPCLSCKHYLITWDKRLPYGCKAFGFKSAIMPCHDVRVASNIDCLKYETKSVHS